jgi:RNA polymerase subunit RPABC4/transcription elongation factor Spt4
MSNNVKICPSCASRNSEDAWNCVSCGETLSLADLRQMLTRQCANCGRNTPEDAEFCPYCGHLIVAFRRVKPSAAQPSAAQPSAAQPSAAQPSAGWEYREFIYRFSPREYLLPFGKDAETFTPVQARREIWELHQAEILRELHRWLDEGWEPIGEVGPAAIELEHIEVPMLSDATCFGLIVYVMTGLIILAIFLKNEYIAPTQFSVQMRRISH